MILSESRPIARKSHYCDGFYWIDNGRDNSMPPHRCNGIKKGDKYWNQTNTDDGFATFKCCKACEDYAKEHKLSLCGDY